MGTRKKFLSENFHFLVVKFSVHLNRHVFVMKSMVFTVFTRTNGLRWPKYGMTKITGN